MEDSGASARVVSIAVSSNDSMPPADASSTACGSTDAATRGPSRDQCYVGPFIIRWWRCAYHRPLSSWTASVCDQSKPAAQASEGGTPDHSPRASGLSSVGLVKDGRSEESGIVQLKSLLDRINEKVER